MATTPTIGNGNDLPPPSAFTTEDELRELLRVLLSVREGDFSVRAPGHWTGLLGKIADTFNDVVSANQAMATQLERSRDIPIIFITAFGDDPGEIHRAYSAGGADYLVKPLDPEIVRKKVAVFVGLSGRREDNESSSE